MSEVNKLNFSPFPELTTSRLKLRKILWEDQGSIYELHSDATNRQFVQSTAPTSIQDTRVFINNILNGIGQNSLIMWAITLKNTKEILGTICLWSFSEDNYTAELGYEMLPRFHRKGYMNEALISVEGFAFNNANFKTLEAYTHKENIASINLLKKNHYLADIQKSYEHNRRTNESMLVFLKQNPAHIA